MRLTRITGDSDCVTVAPQVIESMGSEMYGYFSLPESWPRTRRAARKGARVREYMTPVAYARKGAALLTNTDSPRWNSLRGARSELAE